MLGWGSRIASAFGVFMHLRPYSCVFFVSGVIFLCCVSCVLLFVVLGQVVSCSGVALLGCVGLFSIGCVDFVLVAWWYSSLTCAFGCWLCAISFGCVGFVGLFCLWYWCSGLACVLVAGCVCVCFEALRFGRVLGFGLVSFKV